MESESGKWKGKESGQKWLDQSLYFTSTFHLLSLLSSSYSVLRAHSSAVEAARYVIGLSQVRILVGPVSSLRVSRFRIEMRMDKTARDLSADVPHRQRRLIELRHWNITDDVTQPIGHIAIHDPRRIADAMPAQFQARSRGAFFWCE